MDAQAKLFLNKESFEEYYQDGRSASAAHNEVVLLIVYYFEKQKITQRERAKLISWNDELYTRYSK